MLGCWDQRPSRLGWLSSVILCHHSGRWKVPVVKHYMQLYTCNLKGLIVNQTCCWAIQCTKLTAWENHYPTTVRAELRIKKYIYNTQIWKREKREKKESLNRHAYMSVTNSGNKHSARWDHQKTFFCQRQMLSVIPSSKSSLSNA